MSDAVDRLRAATFYPPNGRYKGSMRADGGLVQVRAGDIRNVLDTLTRTPEPAEANGGEILERWGENLTAEQWREIAAKNLDCAYAERTQRLKTITRLTADLERREALIERLVGSLEAIRDLCD